MQILLGRYRIVEKKLGTLTLDMGVKGIYSHVTIPIEVYEKVGDYLSIYTDVTPVLVSPLTGEVVK